jgi:hypothetical protein
MLGNVWNDPHRGKKIENFLAYSDYKKADGWFQSSEIIDAKSGKLWGDTAPRVDYVNWKLRKAVSVKTIEPKSYDYGPQFESRIQGYVRALQPGVGLSGKKAALVLDVRTPPDSLKQIAPDRLGRLRDYAKQRGVELRIQEFP